MILRPSRAIFTLLVVLMISALLGGFFGSQAQATTKETEEIDKSILLFNKLLGIVEGNYATEVDPETAVFGAIDGMLRTLDPHSKFFDPKSFTALREDQRGRYYGLGITVTTRFGKLTVVSPPFLGSPAEKVGLRVGDVISSVNGEPTLGMDLNEAVSKLKGPRGTAVNIMIIRPGVEEPLELAVIRDEIAKFTISNSFEIREDVGYIKLDSFAETTGNELREALRKLDVTTMKGLILDLRGNPGGLLTEAIAVSEAFLQRGQTIVETRGRTRGSRQTVASQRVNNENHFPLVVLINSNSASASEIVAGAIQDHDRGLIVGETSFGKGLVQSVFPLSKNAGLALTTQKWYTPSGRLIQRDYSHVSQFDYYNQRAAVEQPQQEIKYSDLGRVVYGGGGITPDYVVPAPTSNEFQNTLISRFAFFTFGRDFLAANPKIEASFVVTDALLEQFRKHLQERNIEFTDADFQAGSDYMKRLIKNEVFYNRLGVSEAAKVLLEGDPQILKALDLMPEAASLASKARAQMAQRQQEN